MRRLSEENVWRVRIGWLVRGRWVLATALTLLGIVAATRMGSPGASRILLSALAFGLINLAHAALDHHLLSRLRRESFLHFELPIAVQLLLDMALLAVLAHGTGGLHSPFLFLFLAPATAAVVLLRRPFGPLLLLCCLLTPLLLDAAEEQGLLGAPSPAVELPFAHLFPWLVLCFGVAVSAALAHQVRRRFRERDGSLSEAEQRIREQAADLDRSRQVETELREQVHQLAERNLIAEMATGIAGSVREPLGIVRARAEALRLMAPETEQAGRIQREVDVLLRSLESVQRGLRGILAFLPLCTIQEDVDTEHVAFQELARLGLDPARFRVSGVSPWPKLPGSQEEMELVTGLLIRLAIDHSGPEDPIRFHLRRKPGADELRVSVRFPVRKVPEGQGTLLRLAVLARVVEKHGGCLQNQLAERGRGKLDLCWPLHSRTGPHCQDESSPMPSPSSDFPSRKPARSSTS